MTKRHGVAVSVPQSDPEGSGSWFGCVVGQASRNRETESSGKRVQRQNGIE